MTLWNLLLYLILSGHHYIERERHNKWGRWEFQSVEIFYHLGLGYLTHEIEVIGEDWSVQCLRGYLAIVVASA